VAVKVPLTLMGPPEIRTVEYQGEDDYMLRESTKQRAEDVSLFLLLWDFAVAVLI
jgi:hypothetical protein